MDSAAVVYYYAVIYIWEQSIRSELLKRVEYCAAIRVTKYLWIYSNYSRQESEISIQIKSG